MSEQLLKHYNLCTPCLVVYGSVGCLLIIVAWTSIKLSRVIWINNDILQNRTSCALVYFCEDYLCIIYVYSCICIIDIVLIFSTNTNDKSILWYVSNNKYFNICQEAS